MMGRVALRPAPRRLLLLLLLLEVVALRQMCLGSFSHSFNIICFTILEPSQELPHFVILGYMGGQTFARYDSDSRKIQPRASWMEKMKTNLPQYWQALTGLAHNSENYFRSYLENLRTRHNQSEGLHILQGIASCDLQGDGSKEGFLQLTDGSEMRDTYRMHRYDLENCMKLLETCLSYGKEALLRREPPVVTVSRRTKEMEDGMETHVCQVHGFYPKEIDASWTRDGEVWLQDTLRGSVAPNADGTFHYWLSIRIDPKERGRYRCHVEHDSLQEPLDVAMKVPESNLGLILGCIVSGLVLVCVIVGTWIFFRNHSSSQEALGNLAGKVASGYHLPGGLLLISENRMKELQAKES